MAEFRDMFGAWVLLVAGLGTVYLWVVTYTTFSSPAKSTESAAPSPSPTHALIDCSPGSLRSSLSTCLRWMTVLFAISGMSTYYVRKVVDHIASAEAKGDDMEDDAYKLAREELKEATKAADEALTKSKFCPASRELLDKYVTAVGMANVARAKAARAKPKEGLARLARRKRVWVKIVFGAGVVSSFVAGIFAACAYYYSLELEYGCIHGVLEIAPFTIVGIIFLSAHFHAGLVAWTKN